MTRLAKARATHLTPEEVAREALRQFDAGSRAPSIRRLASALRVTPSAIYHHFPSRAAIYQSAVDLVWEEAAVEVLQLVPHPFDADPLDVLVLAGIGTRRAFLRHYRAAPYLAATPVSNLRMAAMLALMANVLERIGLEGEEAAAAFHTYGSATIGGVLFAAMRRIAADELEGDGASGAPAARFRSERDASAAGLAGEETRAAIDGVMDISSADPGRDEELFAQGLRRLVASLAGAARG